MPAMPSPLFVAAAISPATKCRGPSCRPGAAADEARRVDDPADELGVADVDAGVDRPRPCTAGSGGGTGQTSKARIAPGTTVATRAGRSARTRAGASRRAFDDATPRGGERRGAALDDEAPSVASSRDDVRAREALDAAATGRRTPPRDADGEARGRSRGAAARARGGEREAASRVTRRPETGE